MCCALRKNSSVHRKRFFSKVVNKKKLYFRRFKYHPTRTNQYGFEIHREITNPVSSKSDFQKKESHVASYYQATDVIPPFFSRFCFSQLKESLFDEA